MIKGFEFHAKKCRPFSSELGATQSFRAEEEPKGRAWRQSLCQWSVWWTRRKDKWYNKLGEYNNSLGERRWVRSVHQLWEDAFSEGQHVDLKGKWTIPAFTAARANTWMHGGLCSERLSSTSFEGCRALYVAKLPQPSAEEHRKFCSICFTFPLMQGPPVADSFCSALGQEVLRTLKSLSILHLYNLLLLSPLHHRNQALRLSVLVLPS